MNNSTSPNGKSTSCTDVPALSKVLAILDVGHGNSAVLIDTDGVVVIDAGPGSSLLEFLTEQDIERIDVVLLSHADQDHIGGLIALLSNGRFRIGRVRLNTDSAKDSKIWDDLLHELGRAEDIDLETMLVKDHSGKFDQGDVRIEVLAPTKYLAGKGAGSVDRKKRKLTTNSMSAVLRLCVEAKPMVLFAADIDQVALDNILEDKVDLCAPIVVFPHHGGRPGKSDAIEFTRSFCKAVSPETVIFSIGRGMHGTPRPEIVAAVRSAVPHVRIVCTQLSEHCADAVPDEQPNHLANVFARGRSTRKCCAGTILISIEHGEVIPANADHKAFIEISAPTALCCKET